MLKISRLLRIFYLCSGLKINLHKSHLYGMGITGDDLNNFAGSIGCKIGKLPFDYLGIKLGANMNRIAHWTPVLETIQNRLASWKAKTLSIGGRLTLVKSVLSSLPIYYLSLYKAPVAVMDQIEGLMKNFLWAASNENRRMHWVSWDVVTTSKADGGLGISKLSDVNLALIAKWAWRFTINPNSLWRRLIVSIHGGRGKWVFLPLITSLTGCWKAIVTTVGRIKLQDKGMDNYVRGKVGTGSNIAFWYDLWLGDTILKVRWPKLFELEKTKRCKVGDRIKIENGNCSLVHSWRRGPRSVEELSELRDLLELVGSQSLSNQKDKWSWGIGDGEEFTVANMKKNSSKG